MPSGNFRKSSWLFYHATGENELRDRIPHTWPSSDENYMNSLLGFVSYSVVILRTLSYWSVRVVSCNFKLGGKCISCPVHLQVGHAGHENSRQKITFAARTRSLNRFQIIIMVHRDQLLAHPLLHVITSIQFYNTFWINWHILHLRGKYDVIDRWVVTSLDSHRADSNRLCLGRCRSWRFKLGVAEHIHLRFFGSHKEL